MEILVDVSNDELFYYIDGHVYYDGNSYYGSNLFPSDWDNSGLQFFSIDEVCHSDPTNYGYFDNFYIDNTWARVEISTRNYLTCGPNEKLIKNVQPIKTWSTTQITFDLDLEGLSGALYLYVIDNNGNISNAYSLNDNSPSTPDSLTVEP